MNTHTGPLLSAIQPDIVESKIALSRECRRLRAYVLILLIDAVLLQLGFALASFVYEGVWWEKRIMRAVQTMLPLYFTIALYNSTYCVRALSDWLFAARKVLIALAVSASLVNFVAFYTKSNAQFSRISGTLGLLFAALALVVFRHLVPMIIERYWDGRVRNQMVINDGGPTFSLEKCTSIAAAKDELDQDGAQSTSRDDDRITRIGAFIRRTSIDELPQLINALKGDMSIVGPRPHALGSRANSKLFWEVDSRYWKRHSLKPGLTGLAQVRGHRGATEQKKDLTDRLQSDLECISSWSLRHDIAIVFQTLLVLRHENAY